MKTVSVIITTYKRNPQIVKQAIDSVINQTYCNREIVIVNDAPDYEKREELEYMINKYSDEVLYIVNEKQYGANYSRNIGVQNSHGEIISFLDDDDYWDLNRLEKIVERIRRGADIVYSDYYIVSDKKTRYGKKIFPKERYQLRTLLAGNYLGGFTNVSFTRKIFIESGELDEEMTSYQDQELFIRLLQKGTLAYIPEPLSFYRINPISISLNSEKKFNGMMRLFEKHKDLFDKYPDSKRRRLESELIYARKQGWKQNAQKIVSLLKLYDCTSRILVLNCKGIAKFIAVKYLKLQ